MAEKEEKAIQKKPLVSKNKLVAGGAIVVVLIALAVAGYFYMQYQKSQQLIQNPTLAAQAQTQALLDSVGKLIELPKDEIPQIATVSDISKLKGNQFFANAKNGDKVLIYTKNKKAILYDPIANMIVDVAPVNTAPTATPTPSGSPKKPTPTPSKKAAQGK